MLSSVPHTSPQKHTYPKLLAANSNPPIFPKTEKFDGTNFGTFKTLITIAASSHGVLGYLRGLSSAPPIPAGIQSFRSNGIWQRALLI